MIRFLIDPEVLVTNIVNISLISQRAWLGPIVQRWLDVFLPQTASLQCAKKTCGRLTCVYRAISIEKGQEKFESHSAETARNSLKFHPLPQQCEVSYHWMSSPANSLDLEPCDFWLFLTLKRELHDRKFESDEEAAHVCMSIFKNNQVDMGRMMGEMYETCWIEKGSSDVKQ